MRNGGDRVGLSRNVPTISVFGLGYAGFSRSRFRCYPGCSSTGSTSGCPGIQPAGCASVRARALIEPRAVDSCASGNAAASAGDITVTGSGHGTASWGSS